MKYLLMCEGKNEETLIKMLLDKDKLIFKREDLIGLRTYNIRQLNHPTIISELKHYNKEVIVCRIGDKQNEKLAIPKELKGIVKKENIFKYCTKPELEILLIINEHLEHEYNKHGNNKPKDFAKENIFYNGKRYDQSSEFLEEYYGGKRIENLIQNLETYKRLKKKHLKDELYLYDLIRNNKKSKSK